MKFITFMVSVKLLNTACTNTYYIVRYAEKEVASTSSKMSTPGEPALTGAGEKRAVVLKEELKNKKIQYIFSTQTRRTISTAKPFRVIGIQKSRSA